ncbi:WD40-repeat-containing domain protein [Flagelloscypha sp. PMI_526]|nr:WD40-repeat-containing domain protein [Flagelloscypha sp. PMI_526]
MARSKMKSKPAATSIISQPAVSDSSVVSSRSAFSPSGNHFALVSLAIDKHRLRVYDTATASSIAEHIVETSTVSHISWGSISLETDQQPQKKKRKKRASTGPESTNDIEVIILGLDDGSLLIFSPSQARILSTLSRPASSSVLSVAVAQDKSMLWVSNADATVRLWNLSTGEISGSWTSDDRIPYSCILPRAYEQDEDPEILAASHTLRLLSLSESTDLNTQKSSDVLASFTGHASPIHILRWDSSQTPPTRFVSGADGDRVLCLWEVPGEENGEGEMVASIPLDSPPRTIMYGGSSTTLLTVDTAGKVLLFPVPDELVVPAGSKQTQHKVPTLLPRTAVTVSSKRSSTSAKIVDATFLPDAPGKIRVARLAGGVKPVFDILEYLDQLGQHLAELKLEDVTAELLKTATDEAALIPNRRYAENASTAVRSGAELGQDEEMDDLASKTIEGELDIDIAELSLGQRLTAISGDRAPHTDDDESAASSEDNDPRPLSKKAKKRADRAITAVPASSLTRTLIQALHSSDAKLLETCLAHSDAALIRNTVRKLPSQLAVPLINACVERLGRGAKAGAGGGGASAQRGRTLVEWVRTVLVVHSGHLLSMPDLVARLAKLHSTLTNRLAIQESLISLSGRLDMVLTQIELRSSASSSSAAAPMTHPKPTTKVSHYVEGESSSDEDEDEDMLDADVDIERQSEGSVEDIELGGVEDSDASESSDDDEDDEDSEDSAFGGANGFIDDEAEEYSDDDDEDSD